MSTNFPPKARITFPNTWAVDSFLLRLKRFSDWEFFASSNATNFRAKPKGALDYILIGLNKTGSAFEVTINAEKTGNLPDWAWTNIYDFARRYRC